MKFDLENIGEDTYLIFSRGHHDLEAFTKYVKEEYSEWGNFFDVAYHHYYRKVGNQYGSRYEPCFPFTKGAFQVTVAQEGWSDNTKFITNKIKEGKLVKHLGFYYILSHPYLNNHYEVWYDAHNFQATKIQTFKSVDEAENMIIEWYNMGRLGRVR